MNILKTCVVCQTFIQDIITQQICRNCSLIIKLNDAVISDYQQVLINCPSCTYQNNPQSIQCKVCEYVFQDKLSNQPSFEKNDIIHNLIICRSCKFQNHIENQYCLKCNYDIDQSPKKQCPVCKFKVKQIIFQKHKRQCQLSLSLIQKQQLKKSVLNITNFFNVKQKIYQKVPQQVKLKNDQKNRMTALQIKAIEYMREMSLKQHNLIKKQLENRVKKLGFNIQDLQNLRFYIQNYAPIIIQIHVSKHMKFFINDTHYRSQFQTNKSSGSLSRNSRIQWENRMFSNQYSKATDFQRVKYGVINFTNDPKGVQCAKVYGPSYFLLKQHVRRRCTFTDKDSSNADASIATLDFCYKIINKMNDKQLKAAFKASKALQQSSGVIITYKQIQIHGPIQFSKDIQRIYVNRDQIKGNSQLLNIVYDFSQKFKIQHDFI